ncbi:hypothetical protein KQX63_06845 [Rhodopseudomonas palustris]|uniref:hypothetical protein n=1 Tax=Rhodopseudomonas palustris TaxID=1076 RepID=UPI0021F2D587|nr:hypothetical protein [Rhodopseudomonas palustris]UYO45725.1 hypothetical protein KQX63_06845 [Rhodopseudomonas palustris]
MQYDDRLLHDTSPINTARLLAMHDVVHSLQGAVVFAIKRDGVVDAHTYGENKFKCE